MNKLVQLVLLAFLLTVNASSTLHAQEGWHVIKSSDGAIEALLPGSPKIESEKRKTLAGTLTTKILKFHSDDVEFSISSTRLSKLIRKFAKDERLYKNAREGVLSRSFGKPISFEKIEIDQVPARELHYEVVDFDDETHNGYHGVAVILVLDGTVYTANAIMAKDAGRADLKKFRESIKIKKEQAEPKPE